MQVDIIGGGAIGLLYGARLAESGTEVTIWTRTAAQAESLRERGIALLPMGGGAKRIITVCSGWIEEFRRDFAGQNRQADTKDSSRWILLTVKQIALTDELMEQVRRMAAESGASVVAMQNGIGHLDKLRSALPGIPLYAAVTNEGAKRHDSRTVEHTGAGEVWFGPCNENERNSADYSENTQKMFITSMQSAGIAISLSNEMNSRIYGKLLINAVINPLTALFQLRNGELPEDPMRLKLMKELYEETVHVLKHAGLFPSESTFDRVLEVCRLTSGNLSSMLSDVRAGRHTEIAYINGGIAKLAKEQGLRAPLNEAMTAVIESLHHMPEKKR